MTSITEPGVVIGAVADLELGESRAYAVDGRQIAVFRMTDGSLRATDAVCPHRAGPLADGQFDVAKIVCPLHQYAFTFADGACTSEGVGAVEVYRIEEHDGDIIVWL